MSILVRQRAIRVAIRHLHIMALIYIFVGYIKLFKRYCHVIFFLNNAFFKLSFIKIYVIYVYFFNIHYVYK